VSAYERHYAKVIHPSSPDQDEPDTQGKECANLIVLLSELYNFQVISSILVFDIIRELLNGQLTEFDVELLLKLVRSMCCCFNCRISWLSLLSIQDSGLQLRLDDPSALKDIIQIVQTKVSSQDDALRFVY
jgi:nucleolar MIF4G domain-containing protein 1